ncbi:MAG: Gfo/Idh/MocA family oxidoreductase [Trueperaceae bacterium]
MIRIGVIGASFAKAAYLPAVRHTDGAEVVALASARKESAQAVADAHDIQHAYDDWRAMLDAHELDLVCIATPTDTHAEMALAAVERGAHVLCEKPMAMDAAEAKAMWRAAEDAGRIHMVDHELRFNPNRRKVARLLREGAIGEVRHAHITNVTGGWSDPKARPKGDWWSSAERGGGRLGANGSHQLDLIRWWFGEVREITGTIDTVVRDRVDPKTGEAWTATADDLVHFVLRAERARLVDVALSGVARHNMGNHTQIFGSEGSILLSNDTEELQIGRPGEAFETITEPDPNAGLPGVNAGIWNVSVVGVMRELVAAIREGRPLRDGATFEDGYRTQLAMDAIRTATRERCWVDLTTS